MSFADPTVQRDGHVKHGTDDSAYVRFYKRNEKGVAKDFVEIMFPGDNRTIVDRQVKEDDKYRWPKHWAAYEAGEEFKADGFPLEQWREVDEGMVREFNHKRIYTVEQLAAVTDQNLANLGLGARELVAKAKAFIAINKDAEAAQKYAAQYEEVKAENVLLKTQLSDLAARLQAMEDAKEEKKRKAKEPATQE